MIRYFILALMFLTACMRNEPSICEAKLMTDSEYAAHDALPDAEQPYYCAIQVIPDKLGPQVRFDVVGGP